MGEGRKGGKNFSWRLGGRLGACRELGVLGPARRCAAARAHFLARRAPRPQLCTGRTRRPGTELRAQRGERPREARMRIPSEAGASGLSRCTSCAGPLGGAGALCSLPAAAAAAAGGGRARCGAGPT